MMRDDWKCEVKDVWNIVVGEPLVPLHELVAFNIGDFLDNELQHTFCTTERWLPNILVRIGAMKSKGEIKRNRPDLMVELNDLDCFWIKIGKKKYYIVVGE